MTWSKLFRGPARYWPIYLVSLGSVALGAIALASVNVPLRPFMAALFNLFLFTGAWLPLTAILVGWELVKARPASPFAHLRENYFTRAFWKRQLHFLPIVACVALFMINFSAMKSAIPLFNPFSWDPAFIAWDRTLFFGTDPWRVIHPILGYPIVSAATAGIYHLWILLIYAGCIYMGAHQPNDALRIRYFVSYFLCWSLIGVVLAITFSSVGPVFMEPLFGDPTFAPLMNYLESANEEYPVLVLAVQQQLLEWHATGQYGLGRGISAMPSMHVSLAVLFWLGMRQVSKGAGRFFGVFAILIFIGSIHTGYHYAVDGIIAAIVTWAIWWLVGRVFPTSPVVPSARRAP